MFIPTQEDLDTFTDVSFVEDLADDELIQLMNKDQYKESYRIGIALADEYRKRFYGCDYFF